MIKHIIPLLLIGLLVACSPKATEFKTAGLTIGISDQGQIVKLADPLTGIN
jgi:hypothetical protein